MVRVHERADAGKRSLRLDSEAMEGRQGLSDPSSGYAYSYRKTVSVTKDKPQLVLDHSLRNTGRLAIHSSVYNHNFLYLDRQSPSPDISITVPFMIQAAPPPDQHLAEVRGNQIVFRKTLTGEDRVFPSRKAVDKMLKDQGVKVEYGTQFDNIETVKR